MRNYRNLNVWNQSIELNKMVFSIFNALPKSDVYELQSQCRRSAISISSNIAEGAGRDSEKDFVRFLHIALGSSFELECQLIILKNVFSAEHPELMKELESVQKQLNGLIKALTK